jgi:alkaline phosphatase
MLGLKSVSHPDDPLPGMDVVIGGGFGDDRALDKIPAEGKDGYPGNNFVPGNVYLTEADMHTIDIRNGGKYVVASRAAGVNGQKSISEAAQSAAENGHRLLGFYGNGNYAGHLPFATANGDFRPTLGRTNKVEEYVAADLFENPTLRDMTAAAITVLSKNPRGFWLMVEPGDVDWANHDDNLDNSIGAVLSGDEAVKTITDWVEQKSNWKESLLIVTADHGHFLVLEKPELLVKPK